MQQESSELAFFLAEDSYAKMVRQLDLRILVGGVARNKDDLDVLHPFAADSFFRFYHVTGGTVDLLFADGRYTLRPGHMYLIPASQPFRYLSPCNFTHYWMHFCSSQLENIEFFQFLRELEAPPDTESQMRDFLHFAEAGSGLRTAMETDLILRRLLLPFLESISPEGFEHLHEQNRFYSVIEYINRNVVAPLSISKLAAIAGMRPNDFSADFRRAFGVPPKQYICQRRMGIAKTLLLSSNLSVKQISIKVGYDNEFFFSRLFKKYTGHSPSNFRDRSKFGY